MSKRIKRLTLVMWLLTVAAMSLLVAMQLSMRDRGAPQVQADIVAPDFNLTDQLGRTVSTADLKGHAWVADFIFTECASACPLMSKHLSDLQSRIPPDVKFVSFTVDPLHDKPAVLLDYARQYHADNDRWFFLTGEPDKEMDAIHGMNVSLVPATPGNQIEHDIHFLLMDAGGRLHGVYDSRLPDQIELLVKDATALSAGAAGNHS